MMNKSYSELIKLPTFDERFYYLKLEGKVAEDTFGSHRYLNQTLYRSPEWKEIRRKVIMRDNACDMALDGYEIPSKVLIHHINQITPEDIYVRSDKIFDLDNLVCVSFKTHQAIHYGDISLAKVDQPIERCMNDTCPWRNYD